MLCRAPPPQPLPRDNVRTVALLGKRGSVAERWAQHWQGERVHGSGRWAGQSRLCWAAGAAPLRWVGSRWLG